MDACEELLLVIRRPLRWSVCLRARWWRGIPASRGADWFPVKYPSRIEKLQHMCSPYLETHRNNAEAYLKPVLLIRGASKKEGVCITWISWPFLRCSQVSSARPYITGLMQRRWLMVLAMQHELANRINCEWRVWKCAGRQFVKESFTIFTHHLLMQMYECISHSWGILLYITLTAPPRRSSWNSVQSTVSLS